MSAFTRSNSAEANSEVKLITLYNADLPANQSQQSFRVQSNTTIFDLINHLKKIYPNKEIQLFIQQNQLFKGNLNTFLFRILQQYNIRTIQFKVIGEPQIHNKQIQQQNQSQLPNQQNKMTIPEISFPLYSQANPQQILKLKEENVYLQAEVTSLKQQNLQLQKQIETLKYQVDEYFKQKQLKIANEQEQKLQLSYREFSEQIQQLKAQLEREKMENDELHKQIDQGVNQKNQDLIKQLAYLQEQNSIIPSFQQQIKQLKYENKNLNDECNQLKRNNQTQLIQIKDANFLQEENQKLMDQLVKQNELNNKEQVIQNINQVYEQQLSQLINKNSVLTKQLTESQQQIKRLSMNYQDYVKLQDDLSYEKQKYLELQKSQEQQYQTLKNTINSLQQEIKQFQIKEQSDQKKENNLNQKINSNLSIYSSVISPQLQCQYQRHKQEQSICQQSQGGYPLSLQNKRGEQETAIPTARSSINPKPAQTSHYMENIYSPIGIEYLAPMQYNQAYKPYFRQIDKK